MYEHWSGLIKEKDIPKGANIEQKHFHMKKRKKSPCFEMCGRLAKSKWFCRSFVVVEIFEGEIVKIDVNKSSLEDI